MLRVLHWWSIEPCAHVETKLNMPLYLILDIMGQYIVVLCLFEN